MSPECEDALAALLREIEAKQLRVKDQAVLIEVLDHDGHAVDEQRKALAKDQAEFARQIATRSVAEHTVNSGSELMNVR